jgi:hypothetical protein
VVRLGFCLAYRYLAKALPDMIPIIARLLKSSHDTHYAYLCHPAVDHISKLKKEGGHFPIRYIERLRHAYL